MRGVILYIYELVLVSVWIMFKLADNDYCVFDEQCSSLM